MNRMMFKPITENKLNALVESIYKITQHLYQQMKRQRRKLQEQKIQQPKPETAALVVVASAMLNLDEWVNKN